MGSVHGGCRHQLLTQRWPGEPRTHPPLPRHRRNVVPMQAAFLRHTGPPRERAAPHSVTLCKGGCWHRNRASTLNCLCPPTRAVCPTLARLPQLGGYEGANPLIVRDRTPEGRHYRAPNGGAVRAPSSGDPRRGLLRQCHAELVQQKLVLLVRSGVARQDEVPAVGRWTSTIWIVAKASMMARGVSPLARGRARFFSVTNRQ